VLQSRPGGQPLQVTGRVFDTLLYFIERPGELLDKPGLMQALWPNVVVEEANLTQTIYTLRRVLGETPGEHRYIVTVPGGATGSSPKSGRLYPPIRNALESTRNVRRPRTA
jgi:DNA-binding winged helix-turn-helix (wHTH) protein